MALERRTRALFVGEPTGFAPRHFGDARSILLPGSKLVARLASRVWQEDLPGVERTALEPDLPAPLLARHHFEDDDPALEAVRRHQGEAAAAPLPAPARLPARAERAYLLSPHHRVRLADQEEGARLSIDSVGPFALLDLHGEPPRLATGRRGVELELRDDLPPVLHWHGRAFELEPVDPDHPLPYELVEAGEIAAGVAAYRAAAGEVEIGSAHELAVNRIAYRLLREGRSGEATELFRLLAELFPLSANTWDSLGDGLRAEGNLEGAIRAYRKALALDPLFDPSRESLAQLESRDGG